MCVVGIRLWSAWKRIVKEVKSENLTEKFLKGNILESYLLEVPGII